MIEWLKLLYGSVGINHPYLSTVLAGLLGALLLGGAGIQLVLPIDRSIRPLRSRLPRHNKSEPGHLRYQHLPKSPPESRPVSQQLPTRP